MFSSLFREEEGRGGQAVSGEGGLNQQCAPWRDRGAAEALTQRGAGGRGRSGWYQPRAKARDRTTVQLDWLVIGGRKDGWEFRVCFKKKKILTVPQISVFRQGIGSCGVVGIPQGGSRTACGKFLRPGCWVFSPFLNFPLLKIFHAFSAEGPFALLT